MFVKDDPRISHIKLSPESHIEGNLSSLSGDVAKTYNDYGGLIWFLSGVYDIPVEAVLAVWKVESGSLPFIPGKPVLRFEVHKFFSHWGASNPAIFDEHFLFGGRNGQPNKPWQGHQWRRTSVDSFTSFHGTQAHEYAVFDFAASLAGTEAACLSSSFGGPQILGSNYERVGYESATAMRDAMAQSPRWEICAFFDFCQKGNLLSALASLDWETFAKGFNGTGNVQVYAQRLEDYYQAAKSLSLHPASPPHDLAEKAVQAAAPASQRFGSEAAVLLGLADTKNVTDAIKRMLDYRDVNKPSLHPRYWAVIDFRLSSGHERLHIFDMEAATVQSYLCAHGKGSDLDDTGFAKRFSNSDGSNQSSLGIYLCAETYFGVHGLSMRLDGLEVSNNNARHRAIVVHAAAYVSQQAVQQTNRCGRSLGCPAVASADSASIIERLRDGSMMIAIGPE